jgi:hypothetical protein
MARIFIEGFTDRPRNELIHEVEKVIARNGGWTMDHQIFSNKSISLWIVTDNLKIGKMFDEFKMIRINMNPERMKTILNTYHLSEDPEPILLSFSINLINNYSDLKVNSTTAS